MVYRHGRRIRGPAPPRAEFSGRHVSPEPLSALFTLIDVSEGAWHISWDNIFAAAPADGKKYPVRVFVF